MSALKPDVDSTHDLGTTTLRWRKLWVDEIAATDALAIGGNLTVTGNLQVDGATTTINSTTLTVDDKNIVVASGASAAAQWTGSGLTVDGANATLLYTDDGSGTTQWEFNNDLELAGKLLPVANATHDLGSSSMGWNDLYLGESGIIQLGDDQDVTLTHIPDTGIRLNAAMKLEFRDATEFLHSNADGSMTLEGGSTVKLSVNSNTVLSVDADSVDLAQALNVDDTTASTSTTTGSLIVDGGMGLAGDAHFGGDLSLQHDASVLHFGADDDVFLTHVHETGLLLNSSRQIQFGDAATYIHQSTDGQLDAVADVELALTAPIVDIDASNAVRISNDLELDSDAAILKFGGDSDVTLTHVHDTGLLLNSGMALQFGEAGENIKGDGNDLIINAGRHVDLNATNTLDIDAAAVDIETTGAFSIDGAAESNITVATDGADENLTISVTGATASSLILSSAGTGTDAIDINATGGGIDIDANGVLALDGAGGIDIGKQADVAVTVESAAFNLDASGAVTIDGTSTIGIGADDNVSTGNISIGTADNQRVITVGNAIGNTSLDIDAGTGGIAVDTTGAVSLDAAAASNFTTSSGALTLHGAGGINIGTPADVAIDIDAAELDIDSSDTTSLTMTADDAGVKVLTVAASNSGDGEGQLSLSSDSQVTITDAAATLKLDGGATTLSGVSTLDVDTSGLVTIDSSGGEIRLGAQDHDNDITIGADGVRTITLGTQSGTGGDATTKVDMNAATIEADATTKIILDSAGTASDAIDINSAGGLDVDVADAITLDTTSADGHIAITSAHTAGDAIVISANAAAGSILDVDAGILTIDTQGAQTLTSGGAFGVDSTGAVTIDSDAGLTLGGSAVDVDADGGVLSLDGSSGINIGTAANVNVDFNAAELDIDSTDTTSLKMTANDASEKVLTIDAANSNGGGTAKIVVGSTSGTAIQIGHSTSEVTIGDNLTVTGDLIVSGTQTIVDTVTMQAANAVVFEGATANDFESTLTIIDPTADRTIKLPDQSGCLPVLAADSAVQITATPAELNYVDVTAGTATASKALVLDGSKNIATIGTVGCGAITSTGNSGFDQITTSGRVIVDDDTDATSTSDGSLQTDGGLSVAKDAVLGNDLKLLSDAAVIALGVGGDATLTHDNTTGLVIAATPISIDSTGRLDLSSTDGDIRFQDGGTDQLALDLDGTAGEVIMKLMVDSDDFVFQQFDGTEVFRVEDNGDFDIAGGNGSSGVTITSAGQITADGRIIIDNATDATSTIDGSLQTDGGLSVAKDAVIGNDLKLLSDSSILSLGAGSDATLTHDGATGLTIAATPISVNSTGVLSLTSTTDLRLSSTAGDIKFQDGGVDQLAFNLDGTAGEVIVKPMVADDDLVFKTQDDTEVLRFEANGDVDIAGGNGSSGVTITSAGQLTADGRVIVDDATEATSTTDGSLQTDGGLSVAKSAVVGDDLSLLSDAAILNFGLNEDVSLTHVADTGLLLNAGMALQFRAAGTKIHSSGADKLDIDSSGVIEIVAAGNATLDAAALSIDSTDTTNLTMTANDDNVKTLTIATTNAGAGTSKIDIDADGAIDIDAGGALSLQGGAASDLTTSSGALTLNGAGGVNIAGNAAEVDITTSGALDINSGAATLDSTSLAIVSTGGATLDSVALSIDSTDTTNLTMTANDNSEKVLTIDAANSGSGAAKIALGTTSGTAISIGHGTSETTINDNLTISGTTQTIGTFYVGDDPDTDDYILRVTNPSTDSNGRLDFKGGTFSISGSISSSGTEVSIVDPLIKLASGGPAPLEVGNQDLGFYAVDDSNKFLGLIYDYSDSCWKLHQDLSTEANEANSGRFNFAQGKGSALELGKISITTSAEGSDGVATPLTDHATYYNTGASGETSTLAAAGASEGQIKVLAMESHGGGNMVVTVTNPAWSGSTITLSAQGQACTLQYIDSKWYCIGNNGCTFG